jgi:hypothetical protein
VAIGTCVTILRVVMRTIVKIEKKKKKIGWNQDESIKWIFFINDMYHMLFFLKLMRLFDTLTIGTHKVFNPTKKLTKIKEMMYFQS